MDTVSLQQYRTSSPVSVITTDSQSLSKEASMDEIASLQATIPDRIASAVANCGVVDVNPLDIIFVIGAIIQAQIFEDEQCSDALKSKYPVFTVDVNLPPEYGGFEATVPPHILENETLNDLELKEKIIQGVVPTIDNIMRFIRYIFLSAKFFPECNIMALVYVNRLTTSAEMPLTMDNWRGVWLSAIMVAQKVWDDRPLRTSQFNEIITNVPKSRLRDLESTLLDLTAFSTYVKPELYFKYHFELDNLFLEITGSQFTPLHK